MARINVTVDGVSYADDVEPRTLLVQYLRDNVGKTGTVVGCDTSNCGACTVHLDGKSVKSCSVLAVQADGHEVATVEGLAENGTLHPMQRAFHEQHGILTEAWSPLAQGEVLDDETITTIAEAVGKSPAQVVLRWHIERGNIVFPKSTTPARIEENFHLFDFVLEPGDAEAIDTLDRGQAGRHGANPDAFAYVPA